MQALFHTADPEQAGEQLVDEIVQVLARFEEQRIRPMVDELRGLGLDDEADELLADFRRGVRLWALGLR